MRNDPRGERAGESPRRPLQLRRQRCRCARESDGAASLCPLGPLCIHSQLVVPLLRRCRGLTGTLPTPAHNASYDVTDRGSFENIRNWVAQIQQHADLNVNKVLIGNKCDVNPAQIVISEEEGRKLADEYGIMFFQTSAKMNLNVVEAFEVRLPSAPGRRCPPPAACPRVVGSDVPSSLSLVCVSSRASPRVRLRVCPLVFLVFGDLDEQGIAKNVKTRLMKDGGPAAAPRGGKRGIDVTADNNAAGKKKGCC